MIRTSHGSRVAENFKHDELPAIDPAAVAAPERDPKSGRFVAGNSASRRRKLIKVARSLPWLDEARCEPWLAPYVTAAKEHAVDLLASIPPGSALLGPIAEELAAARIAFRMLLAQGLGGDTKALDAARGWLRECRQHALALEGMARKPLPNDGAEQDVVPPWLVASSSKDQP